MSFSTTGGGADDDDDDGDGGGGGGDVLLSKRQPTIQPFIQCFDSPIIFNVFVMVNSKMAYD